jgi:SET domain-containing protein
MIRVIPIEGKGRGVVATQRILGEPVNTIINIAPVQVIPRIEDRLYHPVGQHAFDWDEEHDCVAFGLASLLNHSSNPNCGYAFDYQHHVVLIYAKQDIEPGQECLINYDCPLWFEAKP